MKLPSWLSAILGRNQPKDEEVIFRSVVFLMRKFQFFQADELRAAGEKGWRKRFDGVEDPMYFVVQQGTVTMMKAGPFVLHILHSNKPYIDDPEFVATQLPQEEQRKAWRAHTAWVSIDLMNKDVDKVTAYAAIARLGRNLVDANCVGIYLPGEHMMMPNDGTADTGMQFMIDGELPFQ